MDIHTIPLFIAAAITFSLGIFVIIRNRKSSIYQTFAFFLFCVSVWNIGVYGIRSAPNPEFALLWGRIFRIGLIFLPAGFFHFIITFSVEQVAGYRLVVILAYAISGAFFVFNWTPYFVSGVRQYVWGYSVQRGTLYPLFTLFLLTMIGYGVLVMIRSYSKLDSYQQNRLKYFFFAIIVGFVLGVINFLPVFGLEVYPFGTLGIILASIIGTYSIAKHRLMDIEFVIQKGTLHGIITFTLFVPSYVLLVLIERLYWHEVSYPFTVVVFTLALITVFLFFGIRRRMETALERIFFRTRHDYRNTVREFGRALLSILDIKSLSEKVVDTLTQAIGVQKGTLYLLDEEKGVYKAYEQRGEETRDLSGNLIPKDAPFVQWLHRKGELIIRDEIAHMPSSPGIRSVLERLDQMGSEVCIPLISKGKIVGIITLGRKASSKIYSYDDLQLLSMLANQAAIAVENARLYEDLRKRESIMRRADRLASLGTLTAGLAHEIRNPLVAIKTLTQLLPERLDDEEFRKDFLAIASGEVDRISSLVNELLEFARPTKPHFELQDIREIMDGMVLLISTEVKKKNLQIVTQYEDNLPIIAIDREQIKQVFLNILLNAIEATNEGGMVRVEIRSISTKPGETFVQAEISDTGNGIPEEHLENVFTPFFTTKKKGSGLGLSNAHQIIQEHGGTINVESRVGEGSSFFINLPVSRHEKGGKVSAETESRTSQSPI